MPNVTFSSPVNASFATLWGLLMDKVENPQRYIAEVEEVQVLEKYDNGILRKMKIPGMTLEERITVDEKAGNIAFTLVEHPLFSGEIINQIDRPEKAGEPLMLTFTQNWKPLTEEAEKLNPDLMAKTIEKAVLHIKELAERQEEN